MQPTIDNILSRAAEIANQFEPDSAGEYLNRNGVDTFGVESITSVSGDTLEYLNTGDAYHCTIARINDGDWQPIGGWGDWLEQSESEYDTDNNTVACGYCSHHTPIENDDWYSTVCESCGRIVSNGELPSIEPCRYCGGNCPSDPDNACDGYIGDIDDLYAE